VYPEAGTVSFSAGLHGWAFTLTVFAKLYAKKFGVEEKKMMERLWGDNFFDPATKKWTTKATGTATCKRGFCQVRPRPWRQASGSAAAWRTAAGRAVAAAAARRCMPRERGACLGLHRGEAL
jgi:hypothetical protein